MKNIFEGVEELAELSVIKQMSGDIIQGYLYSEPLNDEETIDWINKGKTVQPV